MYLSPASGTFFVGSTFDVSVFVNTGGNDINAVMADLQFDPRKIQIVAPTTGKSAISVWVAQPTYSNIEGRASFRGGIPNSGINTSSGLVSTITFRVVASGETSISFLGPSKVLLNDGKGTNILSSSGGGVYLLILPPPEGPKVFSLTHPDQNKWYSNNSPTFSWEKEDFITGFSYVLDKSFFGDVDNIPEGGHTSVSFSDLEDGIWNFHIKVRKSTLSWGGLSHYILQIDKTSPALFQLNFKPTLKAPFIVSQEPILTIVTTDNLSGIDHYSLKLIDLTKKSPGKRGEGFFIEISSPYKLPLLEPGQYQVVVRAFDKAGNSRDVSEKIEVVPINTIIYISRRGANVFTVFFEWWKVVLGLIVLIAVVSGIIYWQAQQRRRLDLAEKSFKEAEERLKKDKEDISKKLYG